MKIKVKGEEYNLRITFGGMKRFKDETGKDLDDLQKSMPMEDVNQFLYCNFKSCAKADGKNTEGIELLDLLDCIDLNKIREIMSEAGMTMTVNNADSAEKKS